MHLMADDLTRARMVEMGHDAERRRFAGAPRNIGRHGAVAVLRGVLGDLLAVARPGHAPPAAPGVALPTCHSPH